MDNTIQDKIRYFSLENALKFKGKANQGAVIGKILSEQPELKKDLQNLSKEISKIVNEVNSLNLENIEKEFKKYEKENKNFKSESIKTESKEDKNLNNKESNNKESNNKEKKQKTQKTLPELPNAEYGKVITRIPPEPSKYNHIGHALSFLINYMYAKKYNGKCFIRFEDTNPEKATQEFVDAMIEDVVYYLDIKPDKIMFVSDDMPLFYELAEKLININKAYVCFCDREKMQELREKGISCECSENKKEKNLDEWKKMLSGNYDEGQAVLRLKGNMQSLNHVMRDPVLFRINKKEHYRQKNKYNVWPMYDFENSVEDSITGITHILRSNEFGDMRIELQNYIKDLLGLKKQTIIQYGRFNIKGATTKGREIREKINSGDVSGWDDPSLVTLKAMKRRGYVKETFQELVYEVGLSSNTSKNIDWTLIESINRAILDKKVNRYFFVEEPIKIKIKNSPNQELKLKKHPELIEKGFRDFKTKDEFYISKQDFEKFKNGALIRLMDCLNFKVIDKEKNDFVFDSLDYETFKKNGKLIIHWLPADEENLKNLIDVEVLMPNHELKKGLAEQEIKNLEKDEIVQFQRFGFCKLDEIKNEINKYIFWFTTR
ncbi:MAG: glutamate--tRNA ligase [Candidatus Woesearchaeota archaeon]